MNSAVFQVTSRPDRPWYVVAVVTSWRARGVSGFFGAPLMSDGDIIQFQPCRVSASVGIVDGPDAEVHRHSAGEYLSFGLEGRCHPCCRYLGRQSCTSSSCRCSFQSGRSCPITAIGLSAIGIANLDNVMGDRVASRISRRGSSSDARRTLVGSVLSQGRWILRALS